MSGIENKYSSLWLNNNNIFKEKELFRVETIADGSCFIHSYLYATNYKYKGEFYRKVSNEEKKIISNEYRNMIGNKVLELLGKKNTTVYKSLKTFADFIENEPSMKWQDKIRNYVQSEIMNKNIYLGDHFWYIFTNIYPAKHNLIIFRNEDIKSYLCYNNFRNSKSFVILLNTNDSHYEPIGFKKGKSLITEFERKDVKDITDYCKKRGTSVVDEEVSSNDPSEIKESIFDETSENIIESTIKAGIEDDNNSVNQGDISDENSIVDDDNDNNKYLNDDEYESSLEAFEIEEDDVELNLFQENKLSKLEENSTNEESEFLNFNTSQSKILIKELVGKKKIDKKSERIAQNFTSMIESIDTKNLFVQENPYKNMYTINNCFPVCNVERIKFKNGDEEEHEKHFYITSKSNRKYVGFKTFNNLEKYFQEFDIFGMCKLPLRNKTYESKIEYDKPHEYKSYRSDQSLDTWRFYDDIDFIDMISLEDNEDLKDFIESKKNKKSKKTDAYQNEFPWPENFDFNEKCYLLNGEESVYPKYTKALKRENINLSGIFVKNNHSNKICEIFDYDKYVEKLNNLEINQKYEFAIVNIINEQIYDSFELIKDNKVKVFKKKSYETYLLRNFLIQFKDKTDIDFYSYNKKRFFNSNIYFKCSQENFKKLYQHLIPSIADFIEIFTKELNSYQKINDNLKYYYSIKIADLSENENIALLKNYKYVPNSEYFKELYKQNISYKMTELQNIDVQYILNKVKDFDTISNTNIQPKKKLEKSHKSLNLFDIKSIKDFKNNINNEQEIVEDFINYDSKKIYINENENIYERLTNHLKNPHKMPLTNIYPVKYSTEVHQNVVDDVVINVRDLKNENIPITGVSNTPNNIFDYNNFKDASKMENLNIRNLFDVVNKISNDIRKQQSTSDTKDININRNVQLLLINSYILPFFYDDNKHLQAMTKLIKDKNLLGNLKEKFKEDNQVNFFSQILKKITDMKSKSSQEFDISIDEENVNDRYKDKYRDTFKPDKKTYEVKKPIQPDFDKTSLENDYLNNNKSVELEVDEFIVSFISKNIDDSSINFKDLLANYQPTKMNFIGTLFNEQNTNELSHTILSFDVVSNFNKILRSYGSDSYVKSLSDLKKSKISYEDKFKVLNYVMYTIVINELEKKSKEYDFINSFKNNMKTIFETKPIDYHINSINSQYNNFGGNTTTYDVAISGYSNKTKDDEIREKQTFEVMSRENDNQNDNDGNT